MTATGAGLSVVVAAHQEEATIARLLGTLLGGDRPPGVEVVVVCNGCSDRTAEIAASFGPPVEVLEIPVASKPAALNAGDERATSFPRFYVDADVEVELSALRRVAAALDERGALAGSVRPDLDLDRCPLLVRSYYRVWRDLPQVRSGLVGAGVYGVTAVGRARFGPFPDLIGDDFYVSSLFAPSERLRVQDVSSVVHPARSMKDLLRTRVRVHAGNAQATRALIPAPAEERGRRRIAGWLSVIRRRPELVVDFPVYLGVTAFARIAAAWQIRSGAPGWARAETGRGDGPARRAAGPRLR